MKKTTIKCKSCRQIRWERGFLNERCEHHIHNGFIWAKCGSQETEPAFGCDKCMMEVHPQASICPHCRSSLTE